MVLVVILLQFVEVAVSVFASVNVVQRVVADVVCHVSDEKEAPESSGDDGVAEVDHLYYSLKPNEGGDDAEHGRENEAVAE